MNFSKQLLKHKHKQVGSHKREAKLKRAIDQGLSQYNKLCPGQAQGTCSVLEVQNLLTKEQQSGICACIVQE